MILSGIFKGFREEVMNFEMGKPLIVDYMPTEYCKQEGRLCQKE